MTLPCHSSPSAPAYILLRALSVAAEYIKTRCLRVLLDSSVQISAHMFSLKMITSDTLPDDIMFSVSTEHSYAATHPHIPYYTLKKQVGHRSIEGIP